MNNMATIQSNPSYELKLLTKKEIVDGEEQFHYETRKLDFVPLIVTRNALIVKKEIEELAKKDVVDELEIFDKQVAFIADVFKVSNEDIYNGLDASTGSLKIKQLFEKILGTEEIEKDEEKKMVKLAKLMK